MLKTEKFTEPIQLVIRRSGFFKCHKQFPSEKGAAANYQHNAVSYRVEMPHQGLPPFIQSFFNKTDLIKNPDGTTSSSLTVCENDGFILEADNFPGAVYQWEKRWYPYR